MLIKKIDKILVKKNNLEKEYSNLINLKNWVKVNNKSNTFKNDFRKQLQKSYFSFWYGDKPKLKSAELQIADIISLNKENCISSMIKVHETLDYHQNLESKDISPIVNILEELIGNFRILPPNASKSLVAAETYKINSKSSFDTAPSIMSYCKSLEIYLKDEVFGNYIKLLNNENKLSKYIEEASQDKNFNQFKSLIVFIKSGFLELGSAVQCLKLSKGKTASRIKLLGDFNNYLQRYFKVLLDDDKVKMISMLSSKYRNPAVHEKNFQIEDLNIVRSIVAQIFNELLSLKLVKSI